jgi:hypothetical protein
MTMKTMSVTLSVLAVLMLVFVVGCQESQKSAAAPAAEAAKAPVAAEATKPGAKAEAPAAAKKPETGAVITFETTEHDFGAVGPGTKHTFQYKFKNTGTENLKVESVQSTCNCTVPALEKKDYAPGESGQIEVTYTAVTSTLQVTKHINVVTNDKNKPAGEVQLTLKAISVPKVRVTPDNIQLSLIEANAGMPDITLTALDGTEFSIKGITSLGGSISATFDPNAKSLTYTLKPKVDLDKLRTTPTGMITVELTHPECSAVEINYIAKAEFEAKPVIFYISNAEPDKTLQKELWIMSNYDKDFDIEAITTEKGMMKVASQEKQGNKYHLMVDITPPAASAASKFVTDNLSVKIKNGPTLKIRCNIWYKTGATAGSASK